MTCVEHLLAGAVNDFCGHLLAGAVFHLVRCIFRLELSFASDRGYDSSAALSIFTASRDFVAAHSALD